MITLQVALLAAFAVHAVWGAGICSVVTDGIDPLPDASVTIINLLTGENYVLGSRPKWQSLSQRACRGFVFSRSGNAGIPVRAILSCKCGVSDGRPALFPAPFRAGRRGPRHARLDCQWHAPTK